MTRLDHSDDGGAALVLALAMITIISIGLLGLATVTDTNLRTTAAISFVDNRAVGSDSAIDQVITQLRNSSTDGVDPTSGSGGTCTGPGSYVIPSGRYGNGSAITVTCTAKANSGVSTTGSDSSANTPDSAVLATSTTETGISVGGNGTLNVGGNILSNSPLTTANGSISTSTQSILKTTGTIKAVGSCTGPATNYVPSCITGATAQADYDGQSAWDYEQLPSTVIATSGITGHCGTANGLAPGIYKDANTLNTLIAGCNSDVWFQPGVYYFDFTSSSHVLTIANANVNVVGGVLSSTPTQIGSSCDTTKSGVQFVFGGDSRIAMTSGALELCPYIHTSQQEISIYGLRHTILQTAQSTPAQLPTTATSTSGKGAFTNPTNALAFDTSYATYAGSNSKDGVINLGGFDLSSVPTGSTINSAQIRVRYKVANAASSFTSLGLSVTDGSGGTTTIGDSTAANCGTSTTALCRNTSGAVTDQTFTMTTPSSTTALTGITATLTAKTAKSGSSSDIVSLDAASLVVNYTPPATYNAQSGCVVTVGGCDFFTASGSNTNVAIHGTFYSWSGTFNMNLPNNIGVAVQRGAVARTLSLNVPASLLQATPVISLPSTAPGPAQDRDVVLTATMGGIVVLSVEVKFTSGTQVPTVKHWSMVAG